MIEDALVELLTPIVRQAVREELARQTSRQSWVSPRKAAELLGISLPAVYQRARRGLLPSHHVGRNLYIDLDGLQERVH